MIIPDYEKKESSIQLVVQVFQCNFPLLSLSLILNIKLPLHFHTIIIYIIVLP